MKKNIKFRKVNRSINTHIYSYLCISFSFYFFNKYIFIYILTMYLYCAYARISTKQAYIFLISILESAHIIPSSLDLTCKNF